MKYLDEQIELSVNIQTGIPNSGVYHYKITRQNYEGGDIINQDIFFGNVYLQSGDTSAKFDITDIVANDMWHFRYSVYEPFDTGFRLLSVWAMPRYYISVTVGNSDFTSDGETVFLAYRYPNYKSYMDTQVRDYRNIGYDYYQLLLQGRYLDNGVYKYKLTPQYPLTSTNNYEFVITQLAGEKFGPHNPIYRFTTSSGDYTEFEHPSTNIPITTFVEPLSRLLVFDYDMGIQLGFGVTGVTDTSFSFNGTASGGTYIEGTFVTQSQLRQDDYTLAIANDTFPSFISTVYFDTTATNKVELTFDFTEELYNYIINGGYFLLYLFPGEIFVEQAADYLYFRFPTNIIKPIFNTKVTVTLEFGNVGGYFMFNVNDVKAVANNTVHEDLTLQIENDVVAQFNSCPSRYYLMWKDRYGSFQSQRFNEKVTYTEKITKTTITNYRQEVEPKIVEVLPKWKINSDWIPEELYPFYESIYVSPVLILYDTYEDKSYNVNLKGDYTEKTFRGEKKLLNITLELELNKSQIILY